MFPNQGNLTVIDAEPHKGREYGGHDKQLGNIRRPMIILSNSKYNQLTGMVMGMLITSTNRQDPNFYKDFFDFASKISGKIILWQIPTYDFNARHGEIIGSVPASLLDDLLKRANFILSR